MSVSRILVQLDPDPHASVFDAVVAVDSGVDQLLQYDHVEPTAVRDLVYGALFTRGLDQLINSAIFIGGTDVAAGERLLDEVLSTFFGPMRVSVMLDANGANTTAAAAVVAAARHLQLGDTTALVLGGTGPVGQRVTRLLAGQGSQVRVGSRSLARAEKVCDRVAKHLADQAESSTLHPVATEGEAQIRAALDGAQLVVAAGAAGVQLLPQDSLKASSSVQVAIDLNAVPPTGIEGIDVMDKAADQDGVVTYGAIGVGGTKMKTHKAALQKLFTANNLVLDAEQIFEIGQGV